MNPEQESPLLSSFDFNPRSVMDVDFAYSALTPTALEGGAFNFELYQPVDFAWVVYPDGTRRKVLVDGHNRVSGAVKAEIPLLFGRVISSEDWSFDRYFAKVADQTRADLYDVRISGKLLTEWDRLRGEVAPAYSGLVAVSLLGLSDLSFCSAKDIKRYLADPSLSKNPELELEELFIDETPGAKESFIFALNTVIDSIKPAHGRNLSFSDVAGRAFQIAIERGDAPEGKRQIEGLFAVPAVYEKIIFEGDAQKRRAVLLENVIQRLKSMGLAERDSGDKFIPLGEKIEELRYLRKILVAQDIPYEDIIVILQDTDKSLEYQYKEFSNDTFVGVFSEQYSRHIGGAVSSEAQQLFQNFFQNGMTSLSERSMDIVTAALVRLSQVNESLSSLDEEDPRREELVILRDKITTAKSISFLRSLLGTQEKATVASHKPIVVYPDECPPPEKSLVDDIHSLISRLASYSPLNAEVLCALGSLREEIDRFLLCENPDSTKFLWPLERGRYDPFTEGTRSWFQKHGHNLSEEQRHQVTRMCVVESGVSDAIINDLQDGEGGRGMSVIDARFSRRIASLSAGLNWSSKDFQFGYLCFKYIKRGIKLFFPDVNYLGSKFSVKGTGFNSQELALLEWLLYLDKSQNQLYEDGLNLFRIRSGDHQLRVQRFVEHQMGVSEWPLVLPSTTNLELKEKAKNGFNNAEQLLTSSIRKMLGFREES